MRISIVPEVDWLTGTRRFPGDLRLPGVAAIIKVESKTELTERCRFETRYHITSAALTAEAAALAVRGHWRIENQLHWGLDVVFAEDQSRLRKGHGAKNMAVVRHFAINQVRTAADAARPERIGLRHPPPSPAQHLEEQVSNHAAKIAGSDLAYLDATLRAKVR